jgi:hypothetical protein
MADIHKYTSKEVLNKVLLDSSGDAVNAFSHTTSEALNAALDDTNSRLNVSLAGGTISGDVTISGDLTVSGGGSLSFDEILEGTQVIDVTSTEAFLVRKNGDGGDVFVVDTTNEDVAIGGTLAVVTTTNSDVTVANFQSAIDANGEHSIIRVGHSSKAAYMGLLLNSADTAYFGIDDNPDDGNGIYVNESGQIGIGNKIPTNNLYIEADSGDEGITIHSAGDTGNAVILDANRSGAGSGIGTMIGKWNGTTIGYMGFFSGADTTNKDDAVIKFATTPSGGSATVAMTIDSSQNVGIGTTGRMMSGYDANSTTLTVYDGSGGAQSGYLELGADNYVNGYNAGAIVFINNNNADATNHDANGKTIAQIRTEIATTDNNAGDDSGGSMTFWTKVEAGSLTERMRITSAGQTNLRRDSTQTAPNKSATVLTIKGYGAVNKYSGIGFNYGSSGDVEPPAWIGVEGTSFAGNTYADIVFATRSVTTDSVPTERMRIDSAGNVDIGGQKGAITTDTQLTISGGEANNAIIQMNADNGDDNADKHQFIAVSGALAYREYSTGAWVNRLLLDANSRISLSNNDSGTGNTIFGKTAGASLDAGSNYNTFIGEAVSDASMDDATYNVGVGYYSLGALTTGDDNVAIGASALLASTVASDCIAVGSSALAAVNHNDASGSVGIGHQALTALTSGIGNVAIGYQSLDAEVTGDYSTAVGHQSLTAQTGVDGSVGNTAIGFQSGMAITLGRFSTAIGASALRTEDVGDRTVAIGFESLYSQNSDSNNEITGNTGIGYGTGYYNVTGTNNTFVGYNAAAGQTGQSNSNNVAVGSSALLAVTTGSGNVAVGKGSLLNNTDGNSNIAIGLAALETNIGTDYNTAIGYASGKYTTGADNTYVGFSAGKGASGAEVSNTGVGANSLLKITDGGYNVALGSRSGEDLTTGDFNVFVGDYAGHATVDADNCIAIGHAAMSANVTSDGDGTVAIGRDALVSLVSGIGNVAIGYQSMDANATSDYNTAVGHSTLGAVNSDGAGMNSAVGYNAGGSITSGLYNTILGANAGDGFDAESDNTFIGYAVGGNPSLNGAEKCVGVGSSALGGAITQDGTVAIGYNTLASLTSGAGNIAVGYQAGASLTAGANNTIIGHGAADTSHAESGSNVAVGTDAMGGAQGAFASSYNVALGHLAMGTGTLNTAAYNVAVGHNALTALTTGDSNIAVGREAGDTITTGTNNVFLGFHTEASAVDVTYEIVIGAGVDTSNAFAGAGTETCKIGRASDFISVDFGENATWSHSSDIRIKKDIEDSDLGLSFINYLRPVTFKKKAPSEYPETFDGYDANEAERKNPDRKHYGFIAQEVKEAMDKAGHSEFPVWSENSDGMQMIGEAELITPLIKAIQELSAKVEALEKK